MLEWKSVLLLPFENQLKLQWRVFLFFGFFLMQNNQGKGRENKQKG